VATMCRVLGVSTSGFYAWLERPPSARAERDAVILEKMVFIHERSRVTYGAPRIHFELGEDFGIRCGKKRVARLMRKAGFCGVHRRRKVRTTWRDDAHDKAVDLVQREFDATEPVDVVGIDPERHGAHSDRSRCGDVQRLYPCPQVSLR
jgi:putative transposase